MYKLKDILLCISIIIIIDLVLVIIWLFTATADTNFFSHFSFASTVASIILSILAIFMSVMGEAKTQLIRDRIESETRVVTDLANRLDENIKDVLEKIKTIDDNTANIKSVLKEHPENVQITSIQNDDLTINDNDTEC